MAELSWHWWSLVELKVTVRLCRSYVCCWRNAGLFIEFKDGPGFISMPCLMMIDSATLVSRVMYVLACPIITTVTPQSCLFVPILRVTTMTFSVLPIMLDFLVSNWLWMMCSACSKVLDLIILLCHRDWEAIFLGAKFYKQICFQLGLDFWVALNLTFVLNSVSTQRLASGRAENRSHKSVNRVFSVWLLEQLSCLSSVPALLRDPQGPVHAGIHIGRKCLGLLNSSHCLKWENKWICFAEVSQPDCYLLVWFVNVYIWFEYNMCAEKLNVYDMYFLPSLDLLSW